jgi:hypothetical protein
MSTKITFEVLSVDECRALLASQDVGRVAFLGEDGFPIVLPVNYLIDGELIVFRSDTGAKYESIPKRPVAFEVDRFERWNRGGWSVLAQGFGEDLTTATSPRYDALRRRTISTWAPLDDCAAGHRGRGTSPAGGSPRSRSQGKRVRHRRFLIKAQSHRCAWGLGLVPSA